MIHEIVFHLRNTGNSVSQIKRIKFYVLFHATTLKRCKDPAYRNLPFPARRNGFLTKVRGLIPRTLLRINELYGLIHTMLYLSFYVDLLGFLAIRYIGLKILCQRFLRHLLPTQTQAPLVSQIIRQLIFERFVA